MEVIDYEFDIIKKNEVNLSLRSSGSSSSLRGVTIWGKLNSIDGDLELDRSTGSISNYPFCRIRTFLDTVLAEKYLEYLDRYFELHPEFGVEELFLKVDGDPVYQIYFVTSIGNIEVVGDDDNEEGLWFDYSDMLDQLKSLKAGNPEFDFHFREVEIDDQSELLEIPGI